MTMQQLKNINKTDKHIHTHKKRYLEVRYLEFDGTMEKIWVNRSSTQEELWKYRKCSLFNNERETTRAKFWRAKTSIACPYSQTFKADMVFIDNAMCMTSHWSILFKNLDQFVDTDSINCVLILTVLIVCWYWQY
jgi:hypothetical protein